MNRDSTRRWLYGVADFIVDHPKWSLLLLIAFSVLQGIGRGIGQAMF